MRIFRDIFAKWGKIDRCRYSRSVMAQLYFPVDSPTDLFVAKVPVDEGVKDVADVDIIINSDTKELIVIAKRKQTITVVDELARLSPIPASPLESPNETERVVGFELR